MTNYLSKHDMTSYIVMLTISVELVPISKNINKIFLTDHKVLACVEILNPHATLICSKYIALN